MADRDNILADIKRMAEIGQTSVSGLGIKAGKNKSTFNKYFEEGNTSIPSIPSLNMAAQSIGYEDYKDFVIRQALPNLREVVEVPVVATAPGGTWFETFDHVKRKINYVPKKPGTFVGVEIVGGSVNRFASDGDTVVVDLNQTDSSKLSGKAVIVQCGGEVTCKIYRSNPDRFEPFSHDPSYQTIFPQGECKILGRVVDVVSHLPEVLR